MEGGREREGGGGGRGEREVMGRSGGRRAYFLVARCLNQLHTPKASFKTTILRMPVLTALILRYSDCVANPVPINGEFHNTLDWRNVFRAVKTKPSY